MQAFIKKHLFILIFLFLGIFAGTVIYMTSPKKTMYRLVYEHRNENMSDIPKIFLADTLVEWNDLLFRINNTSIADTLTDEGISRKEMKIYSTEKLSEDDVNFFFNSLNRKNQLTMLYYYPAEITKSVMSILNYSLLGLFIGVALRYFLNLKKKFQEK